jgi:hypothetical protein
MLWAMPKAQLARAQEGIGDRVDAGIIDVWNWRQTG